MREYAKVGPKFWIGATGKKLRAAGMECQIVAMYLMSSPHANMLGLYYVPKMFIAHETGLGLEGASKGLQSAIDAGFCQYDEASETVWVIEMAKFQIAESLTGKDLRIKGVQNEYDSLPTNPYLAAFFEQYGAAFCMTTRRGSPTVQVVEEQAPSKPLASQEQEQEQAQEQEQDQEQAQANPVAARSTVVELSIAFRKCGVATQPHNPLLHALAEQGVGVETVEAACAEAKRVKPKEVIGLGYVMKILERWAADAAQVRVAGATAPKGGGSWWASDAASIAKGAELGLKPRPGERMNVFQDRIRAAIEGPAPVPAAQPAVPTPAPQPKSVMPAGLDLRAMITQPKAVA